MDTVIAFLSLALFIAFIVGLIKPSLVRMPNRKRSSAVYLGGCLALAVIGSILWPTEKSQPVVKNDVSEIKAEPTTPAFKYADKTLKEYRNEPKETRHDIVKDYVGFKGVPANAKSAFYACMSEYTFTKDESLKLGDVLAVCPAAGRSSARQCPAPRRSFR